MKNQNLARLLSLIHLKLRPKMPYRLLILLSPFLCWCKLKYYKIMGYEIFRSYSQQLEDIYLYHEVLLCPFERGGVFVEIGAYDGITFSNSKFFEDYLGYDCVLIEPSESNYLKLKHNRPKSYCIKCAISSTPGRASFVTGGAVGGLQHLITDEHVKNFNEFFSGNELVDVMTFEKFANDNDIQKIDVLSIDCEGGDLEALRSINFLKISISIIIIEVNPEFADQIHDILDQSGYLSKTTLFGNQVWISSDYASKFSLCKPKLFNKIAWYAPFLNGKLRANSLRIARTLYGSPVIFW